MTQACRVDCPGSNLRILWNIFYSYPLGPMPWLVSSLVSKLRDINHKLALRIIVLYFMSLHKYSENVFTLTEDSMYLTALTLYTVSWFLTAPKHWTTTWYLYSESRRLLCRLVRIIMSSVQWAVIHYYRQDYLRSIIPSTEIKF